LRNKIKQAHLKNSQVAPNLSDAWFIYTNIVNVQFETWDDGAMRNTPARLWPDLFHFTVCTWCFATCCFFSTVMYILHNCTKRKTFHNWRWPKLEVVKVFAMIV
jgi:hypothetical protein